MYRLSDGLHAALREGSPTLLVRLVSLWPDGSERATFDLSRAVILSGSVRAELRRDARRSASLVVSNADGALAPAVATDMLAQGAGLRVEAGALVDGEPALVPLVTGFVAPGTEVAMRAATVTVAVESRLSACQQDAGEALQLPAGMPVPEALHALWDPVLPGVPWDVEDAAWGRPLGADVPVLHVDSRLDVGLRLARAASLEAFDDREGAIVVRLRREPASQPVVRAMEGFLDLRRRVAQPTYNAQLVEATPDGGEPVYARAEVDDPGSPIHRSRVGLRVAPTIRTDSADDPHGLAAEWLAGRMMRSEEVVLSLGPEHLDLDPGDVVSVDEPTTRTSARIQAEAIEVMLGPGQSSLTGTSVLPLFVTDAA